MKLTIKNLKYSAFASTDSNCFEATVYIDGKRAFIARDEGRGGCIDFDPLNCGEKARTKARELMRAASEWASNLPPVEFKRGNGEVVKLDQSLEMYVGELVIEELNRRDRKKQAAKGVAFILPDDDEVIHCYPWPSGLPKHLHEKQRELWITGTGGLMEKLPEAKFIGPDGRFLELPDPYPPKAVRASK